MLLNIQMTAPGCQQPHTHVSQDGTLARVVGYFNKYGLENKGGLLIPLRAGNNPPPASLGFALRYAHVDRTHGASTVQRV